MVIKNKYFDIEVNNNFDQEEELEFLIRTPDKIGYNFWLNKKEVVNLMNHLNRALDK